MKKTDLINSSFFSGYKVMEVIGEGSFGTVYKAVKKDSSGEYVRAIKHILIPTKKQIDSAYIAMNREDAEVDRYFDEVLEEVVSEITILNTLSEKGANNIVRYYDHVIKTTNSVPKQHDILILMEHLTPLQAHISKAGFTVCDVVRLGLEILESLQICHDNQVMHRDIKDDNILVTLSGEFKIGDFGVSKLLRDTKGAETIKGSNDYIAPEVYAGEGAYSESIDLYSLGIVMYRLLNYNRNPFMPLYPAKYMPQDVNDAFNERMKGHTPDMPAIGGEHIGKVIVKAISSKEQRYVSANEFYAELVAAKENTHESTLVMPVIAEASTEIIAGSKTIKDTLAPKPKSRIRKIRVAKKESKNTAVSSDPKAINADTETIALDPFAGLEAESTDLKPGGDEDNRWQEFKEIIAGWWQEEVPEKLRKRIEHSLGWLRRWGRRIITIILAVAVAWLLWGVVQRVVNSFNNEYQFAAHFVTATNLAPNPNHLRGTETVSINIIVNDSELRWGTQRIDYSLHPGGGGAPVVYGYVEVFLAYRIWNDVSVDLFTYDFMHPNSYVLRLRLNNAPLPITFGEREFQQITLHGHGR